MDNQNKINITGKKTISINVPPIEKQPLYQLGSELQKILSTLSKGLKLSDTSINSAVNNYLDALENKLADIKDFEKRIDFLISEKARIENILLRVEFSEDTDLMREYKLIKEVIIKKIDIITDNLKIKNGIQKLSYAQNLSGLSERSEVTDVTDNEADIELPDKFRQINCKATKSQIINFFMILAKTNNELFGIPYMKEEDVMELVEKNFKIFCCKPYNKFFPINLTVNQKIRLRHFIQDFYNRYSYNSKEKERYAYFLIHNFDIFRNDKLNVLKSNMGLSKKPVEAHKIKIDWKTI